MAAPPMAIALSPKCGADGRRRQQGGAGAVVQHAAARADEAFAQAQGRAADHDAHRVECHPQIIQQHAEVAAGGFHRARGIGVAGLGLAEQLLQLFRRRRMRLAIDFVHQRLQADQCVGTAAPAARAARAALLQDGVADLAGETVQAGQQAAVHNAGADAVADTR
jgi:hypothetical protein